jgi:hypothetical protein
VGSGPISVAVGDFNNDGKLDLATANGDSSNVTVLLNTCTAATAFGQCLQDDGSGNVLQFNSAIGNYRFTTCGSGGFSLSGTAVVTVKGSVITLQDNSANRRVLARIDNAIHTGTASVQVFSQGTTFTITNRNTTKNTCTCP